MFTGSEYDRIMKEFNVRQNERRTKLKKIWGFFLILTIFLIGLFILIFPNMFDNGETAWILPVYGGMAFVTTLIGFLASMNYLSEKPYFEYLYQEVVNKLNMDEGLYLEYKEYDKDKHEFHKNGGLFTRYATVTVRRKITGRTENQQNFSIYDCSMTTSNGKSQTTHFDGVYYVLEKQLNTSFQVRSHGSPKLKGVKFERIKEYEDQRVYKELDQQMMNIDHQFLNFYNKMMAYNEHKRIHIGIIDGEIHVAITYFKHPAKKVKPLTQEKLNLLLQHFKGEHQLINEIANIEAY